MTKDKLIKTMKDIDICMMSTVSNNNELRARPMSNNGNVENSGVTYFFSEEDTEKVENLESHRQCALTYQKDAEVFIEVFVKTKMTQDKSELKKYWKDNLENWFKNGLETKGLTLIEVQPERIEYWKGREHETITF